MNKVIDQKEYLVLARKYRPQRFEDLIGQKTLVETLSNALSLNRVAHAYLLTGVRGVGKTTTARLIAMALNCETKKENNIEPCAQCESCISIKEDRNIDVIEIDAASKTGVDDIREIIDNVKYKPVISKYKIFIIDEVHMLSKNAFNALLKTLEEPPPHIKFLFATTEVKKIPITIISRCQRFDLNRIDSVLLTEHFINISKKEKIEISKEALALIVRASDGSVRDGLSLLDQAIANEEKSITEKTIIKMLGLADRGKIFNLIDEIFKGNANNAINIFNDLYNSGVDVLMIFDEMLKITHFLTQIKINPSLKDEIHIPEADRKMGTDIANKISISSLGSVWQVLFKGYQELQISSQLHQHGEMIIVRLIYLYDGPSPDDLVKKIEDTIEKTDLVDKSEIVHKAIENTTINKLFVDESSEIEKSNKSSSGNISIKSFRNFVDLFYQKKEAMLHTYLYNNTKLISFEEGKITVNIEKISDPHFSRTVAKLISKWTDRIWQITISDSNIGKTLYEEDLIIQQKEIEKMNKDLEVRDILTKYPGTKIHSISKIELISDDNPENDKQKNIKEK